MSFLQDFWRLIEKLTMDRAMKSEISDDQCVACESADVDFVADRVYRCNMCGYEGGSGYAAYKEGQQRRGFDALSHEKRHELGIARLEEASTLILSGIGDLEGALHASRQDVSHHDDHGANLEKQDQLFAAFRLFTEANELTEDAVYLLGRIATDRPDMADVMELAMDSISNVADLRWIDSRLHRRIEEARDEAEVLMRWCKHTLAEARKKPPAAQEDSAVW